MDIAKAFSYVFEDRNWPAKILIGGILSIIPIVNFIPIGYALTALRNIAEGKESPLPEWDNWGGYFSKGLMAFLAGLIYALPIFIIIGFSSAFAAIAGAGEEEALTSIVALCTTFLYCLNIVYSLALSFWLSGALTFYALRENFGALFSLGEIFRFISANIGNYLLAWILSLVASFVAGFGVILCVVGVLFTGFWAYLVWAHLFGQVWRQASQKATA